MACRWLNSPAGLLLPFVAFSVSAVCPVLVLKAFRGMVFAPFGLTTLACSACQMKTRAARLSLSLARRPDMCITAPWCSVSCLFKALRAPAQRLNDAQTSQWSTTGNELTISGVLQSEPRVAIVFLLASIADKCQKAMLGR